MIRRCLAFAALLLLAGCAYYTAVPPNRVTIKGAMSVDPALTWAKVDRPTPDNIIFSTTGQVETWTIDGEPLDSLIFFAGISDGQSLLDLPAEKGHLSAFRSSMTPNDVMDLFGEMLTKATGSAVAQSRNLRPAKLGGVDGFRFDVDFALKDDVDRELTAVGAVKNGKLYLIAFQGTKLYHFGKYLPEFEHIVASATLSGS